MKVNAAWLKEWVEAKITPEQLAEQLTMAGLEVAELAAVAGEFSGIIVGEVLEVTKHPNAEKLHICQVNTGKETLEIVCGASNVRPKLKVAVGVVGAVLPGNFKIKQVKLRGVVSNGMICSESELGLAATSTGIMELASDAPVGKNVRDYLALDDLSFDIELTPNRGDCSSVAGIAREVAAITNNKLKPLTIAKQKAKIKDTFPIKVSSPDACANYTGRVIRGINPHAVTPLWMRERLRRCGLRSIAPVVDVTNYVLLELGQPMHAFDLAELNKEIQVRFAKPGEPLTLLDETKIKLTADTLIIADNKNPLAIAGVMGGLQSGVTTNTTDIFLESAYFDPVQVTKTARRFNLDTDSSYRFARGVDPKLQAKAIERATELLLQIVGGKPGPICQQTSKKHLPVVKKINLRRERIAQILGVTVPDKQVQNILLRLGFQVKTQKTGWLVTVPSYRFDVELEIDLIEEVARIYGYNEIPYQYPQAKLRAVKGVLKLTTEQRLRSLMVGHGFQEVITYSFVDPKLQRLLDPDQQPLVLTNPISSELSVMRTNLWPGLVQTALYNQNRQQERLRIFETGLKFVQSGKSLQQLPVLAGLIYGQAYPEQWGEPQRTADFYDLKNTVQAVLNLTNKQAAFAYKESTHATLHAGHSATITLNNRQIGLLGELHPGILQSLKLDGPIFLFEIDLSLIYNILPASFNEISKYPEVKRDIAIIVAKEVSVEQIITTIQKATPNMLRCVKIFDVYQGQGISVEQKSLALRLIFQRKDRTLQDKEIDKLVIQVVEALKNTWHATLRG